MKHPVLSLQIRTFQLSLVPNAIAMATIAMATDLEESPNLPLRFDAAITKLLWQLFMHMHTFCFIFFYAKFTC